MSDTALAAQAEVGSYCELQGGDSVDDRTLAQNTGEQSAPSRNKKRSFLQTQSKMECGGILIRFETQAPDSELRETVIETLGELLREGEKDHFFALLSFCLQEVYDNAVRANLKRAYFADRQYDINDRDAYEHRLGLFLAATRDDGGYWIRKWREYGYSLAVEFRVTLDGMDVVIVNNAGLLPAEHERICERMEMARIHECLAEMLEDISDESESAGLGIVAIHMILRRLGLGEDSFRIQASPDETAIHINIRFDALTEEESQAIGAVCAKEIDSIPQFPTQVLKLRQCLEDPDVEFRSVCDLIRSDPGLTIEVLRLANSSYYRRATPVEDIHTAVMYFGVYGLSCILDSYGARQALSQSVNERVLNRHWLHSREVADITAFLCARFGLGQKATNQCYTIALLHDIGRIVLESRHPKTCAALEALCRRKAVSVNSVQDLVANVDHAMIGAALASKWDLPDFIAAGLKYYRYPCSAPDGVQRSAGIVHLAHVMSDAINGRCESCGGIDLPTRLGLQPTERLDSLLDQWESESGDVVR